MAVRKVWSTAGPPASETMASATARFAASKQRPGPPPVPPVSPKTARQRLLAVAFALGGAPYRWAAKGPRRYDCSGFTKAACAAAGVSLPDGSFNPADREKPLRDRRDLTPGDLLFYRWHADDGVTHVTVYAGAGCVIGTGTPGKLRHVVVYPLADDLRSDGRVITYRHIRLRDDRGTSPR